MSLGLDYTAHRAMLVAHDYEPYFIFSRSFGPYGQEARNSLSLNLDFLLFLCTLQLMTVLPTPST